MRTREQDEYRTVESARREVGTRQDRRTVLVVEDDAATRVYLEEAVAAHPELVVSGAVGTLAEAREALLGNPPDVLLTDLGLPDGSGIDLIREARGLGGDIHILVISVFGDERSVIHAIEAGARGYLLKDSSAGSVGASIEQLLAGGAPISAPIARHLLERLRKPLKADAPHLSEREREVLQLVAKGFSYPEIARLLQVSVSTVTTHVRRMYRKLEVRSRGEAVYEALNLGLLDRED